MIEKNYLVILNLNEYTYPVNFNIHLPHHVKCNGNCRSLPLLYTGYRLFLFDTYVKSLNFKDLLANIVFFFLKKTLFEKACCLFTDLSKYSI